MKKIGKFLWKHKWTIIIVIIIVWFGSSIAGCLREGYYKTKRATTELFQPSRRTISVDPRQEDNSCSRSTPRRWLPDNDQSQRQHRPQAQTAEVFAIPVRDHSPRARWIEQVKMFRDEDGFFITPPNILMWDGDRGNMEWACPFDEFAQFHPAQANRIAQEYGNSGDYEYWNVEGIVQRWGPEADPYRRGRRW